MRLARYRLAVARRVLLAGVVAAALGFGTYMVFRSDSPDEMPATTADIDAARAAAVKDARHVLATTQENTMERERAVIELRARESAIRKAGFVKAADAYATTAQKELKVK